MNKPARTRIGVMAIGLEAYWGQFPGMREYLDGKHRELVAKLPDTVEITDMGMVDTAELSIRAGRLFLKADVDLVFVQLMTYSPSDNMIPAVKDLDVPVILLNVQEREALDLPKITKLEEWLGKGCTCAGLPELSAMLIRYGLRYDIVTGCLHGDRVVDDALNTWCRAAGVRRKMRSTSVGLLGRQFPGMMDLYVDENAIMRQFGMMTRYVLWEDVIAFSEEVSPAEKEDNLRKLREVFEIPGSILQVELDMIGCMYGGYKRLAREHNLSVLASHFERETAGKEADMIAALNPAHTMMIRDGIACTVEGDIKAGIAMLILKQICGSANLAELYSMDFNDDVVIVGHSGASDPCIADQKPVLKTTDVFHGKSGKGFTTQAVPREGPITMLAVTMQENGQFIMVAAEGTVAAGDVLLLGDTNCRIRFAIPMREFVNRWCLTGPSHHAVMGSGHHVESLKAVAKVLNIALEVIA